ncbi:YtcA family lipoprotein [Kosakonia oryziphila]|uniref:YtcA family lipoprotein n=1 Tax=Kosakonia oryziphila TaxID=1005667 RepID=UPI000B7E4DDA|nr:YtcA family lipoprotein [Kosakonia oryziphila]
MCRQLKVVFLVSSALLSGCVSGRAPTFFFLGSYFPVWIVCAVLGMLAAILGRLLFIRLGIDEVLPCKLLAYVFLMLGVACGVYLSLFT